MDVIVEVEGSPPRTLAAPELAAFMSFCVVRGFGAQHPLIALADRLHDQHRVRLGPLTTFYDANLEDAEDREKVEHAWQDAGDLRDALVAAIAAIETDPLCQTFVRRAGAESLPGQLGAVEQAAREAAVAGKKLRLLYRD